MRLRMGVQSVLSVVMLLWAFASDAQALSSLSLSQQCSFWDTGIVLLSNPAERTSFNETRFLPGRQQTHSSSCGPAALANLLNIFFDLRIDEASIIEDMPVQSQGTSLYHVLSAARRLGFQAAVYKMDSELLVRALRKIEVPIIGILHEPVNHYIIAVAPVAEGLLIFDPSTGFVVLPQHHLSWRWSGYTLVVDPGPERIDKCRAITEEFIRKHLARDELLSQLQWITHQMRR